MSETTITVTVNGAVMTRRVAVGRLVRDFVRDELGLTGTKGACQDGMCGSCSLLVDGRIVKSCLMLAAELNGLDVVTIEGLGTAQAPHPVQQALAESFAIQCGFCTPGFAMTIAALMDEWDDPTVDDIRHDLSGNICRCTGYVRIVRAAQHAYAMGQRAVPGDEASE
jgi:carbon-monoxide dehydrogenase small subunit